MTDPAAPGTAALVLTLTSCASTMDEGRALAQSGVPDGTAVLADAQTRGRGTKGRPWSSPPGLGLYVSIVVRPRERMTPADALYLPLAAGLAAREALREACGVETRLKWPNDLVLGGRKLGGILVESAVRRGEVSFAVAGFGLNLAHREADFPEDLRASAVSVRMVSDGPSGRDRVLAALFPAFARRRDAIESGGRAALLAEAEEALGLVRGAAVRLSTTQGPVEGTFLGLEEPGRIALQPAAPAAPADALFAGPEAPPSPVPPPRMRRKTVRFADVLAVDAA